MAYNNYQQAPFWDFVRACAGQNGAGVDHAAVDHPFSGGHPPPPPPPPGAWGPWGPWGGRGFSGPRGGFGPGPHGRGGRHGRHHGHRDPSAERSRSRTVSPSGEHLDGDAREGPSGDERRERHRGPRGCRREHAEGEEGPRGFGRHRGRHRGHGRRGPPPLGGPGGFGHRGPPPHFGGPGDMGEFDLSGLFEALSAHPIAQHPWAQVLRQYAEQAGVTQRSAETLVPEDGENSFVPPIDIFATENAYTLHVALPGAKKEDIGVNFNNGVLNIAGVVHRQGGEELLKKLTQSERKVGVFDRDVKLPPANEEKEEIDGDNIVAKLEEGVLVVTVPKVEKEWTEVKKIDIV